MNQNPPQQSTTNERQSSVPAWIVVLAVILLLLALLVINGYKQGRWSWEGTGFSGASLWDWLDLLIVPVILGIGGIWFQRAQRRLELGSQEAQRKRELEIQNQHTQDVALQTYFDQIGHLLLEKALLNTKVGTRCVRWRRRER
jgi:hypothetical protein